MGDGDRKGNSKGVRQTDRHKRRKRQRENGRGRERGWLSVSLCECVCVSVCMRASVCIAGFHMIKEDLNCTCQ